MSDTAIELPDGFQPMDTAPRDSTMLRLLVKPDLEAFTSFEDTADAPYETIGFNNLENTDIDTWEFAGWDWSHDCFVTGHGEPIGWAPLQPPEKLDGPVLKPGDEVTYIHPELQGAYALRAKFIEYVEGWIRVEFGDGTTSIIRPSRILKK